MDSLSIKRRLSCILAADAVGYSRHMGLDEIGTVRVLAAHRAVIDGIIAFHEGRIVGTAGDSVLAEFSSVVEAVRCAVEMQESIKTRNDSLPNEHKMLFRVGINLGDVVVRENDLLGDGINVASRLETLAEPGGICISSGVYDQITGKLDLRFKDIGEQNLKNIARPIRVYRISGSRPAMEPLPEVPPPARGHGRGMTSAAGAGLAIVFAALIAWQAGWVRFGPRDDATTRAPGASTPVAAAATPSAAGRDDKAEKPMLSTNPPSPAVWPGSAQDPAAAPKAASSSGESARSRDNLNIPPPQAPSEKEVVTRQSSVPRGPVGNEVLGRQADVEYVRSQYARSRAEAMARRSNRANRESDAASVRPSAMPESGVVWRRKSSGGSTSPDQRGR